MTFAIPGRLPGYNELKAHWATAYRVKRDAKETVSWAIRAARLMPVTGRVRVTIRCFEPNARRDPDNVTAGAAKIILDALQDCGILAGDGRRYIAQLTAPTPVVDKNKPRVEVEIEEDGT